LSDADAADAAIDESRRFERCADAAAAAIDTSFDIAMTPPRCRLR
jgi:hypothetical protein